MVEENIVINDENLLYSLSNSLDDIEIAIYAKTAQTIDLKDTCWKMNAQLSSGVKHLMNKHQVKYSMTITGKKDLIVNMRIKDEWYITGFTENDGSFRSWEQLEAVEFALELVKGLSKNASEKKSGTGSKKIKDSTIGMLFRNIELLFIKRKENEIAYNELIFKIKELIEKNLHLEFCRKVNSYNLNDNDFLLFLCFCDYYVNANDNYIGFNDLKFLYDEKMTIHTIAKNLSEGNNDLIKNRYIEHNNTEYYRDSESWRLSDRIKKELLPECYIKNIHNIKNNVISFDSIESKKMFYNIRENEAVKTLIALLQNDNYYKIQGRFSAKGMRPGFTCLFSGLPGTGKTETAYQIARETRRNIIKIDISETNSMWLGESEKNVKAIFDTYRTVLENTEIAPILLLNEADAVIGKRLEFDTGSRSVDKTENRIQNILLEEMENFSGILIATSNLVQNMDSAFERRFLYKITFDKPGIVSRKGIWNTLLPDLQSEMALKLSERFDLSGGQIENIARKIEVDSIIYGSDISMNTILKYCNDEIQNSFNTSKKIGFEPDENKKFLNKS